MLRGRLSLISSHGKSRVSAVQMIRLSSLGMTNGRSRNLDIPPAQEYFDFSLDVLDEHDMSL